MFIRNCKVNHLENPLGYDLRGISDNKNYNLFFSWNVEDAKDTRPQSIQLLISEQKQFDQTIYDSGKITDSCNSYMSVGLPLTPCTRYYWKVIVCTKLDGAISSETQWFETAKEENGWEAEWIGTEDSIIQNLILSRSFCCDSPRDARLYICGLGIYEVSVNGVKCGNGYFTPGCNEYTRWIPYQTYEIALPSGENSICINLANGWYKGRFGLFGNDCVYGDKLAVIAEIRDSNTHELLLLTDKNWNMAKGPVIENNFYDGEVFSSTESNLSKTAVSVLHEMTYSHTPLLRENMSPPVTVHEIFEPMEVIYSPIGETILDFGQNMAGWVCFDAEEESGHEILLQYGEILQNGCFYRQNLRTAKAAFRYIGCGKPESVSPRFTYYGFRYVKIEGLTKPLDTYHFRACAVYSDLPESGSLITGNEKVNKLISNIHWGMKSNYVDNPTDCPQRDEKMGWTADTQVFSGTACFLHDSYTFLKKYCRNMYEVQKNYQYLTAVVPAFDETSAACAGWGDAAVIIPWTLYLFYGDRQILADQFDSMKLWVDFIYDQNPADNHCGICSPDFGFGDWLAFDHDNPKERLHGGTDLEYISTAYYYYVTLLVGKAARILNHPLAEVYLNRAMLIKKAFLQEYFTPTGKLAVTTQTAYVLSLYMGLYPDNMETRVAHELHEKLQRGGGYLKTGFLGTAYIMKVLSAFGYHEDACKLLLNEGVPSWLYEVNMGATTIWERWNSLLSDGSVNGTDMNSFNHYASGAVLEWMYLYLAGIQPLEEHPGFSEVILHPHPCRDLKKLDCSYHSIFGTYEVHWIFLPGKKIRLRITIPFGAKATIYLPYSNQVFSLSAGTYTYEYVRKNDGTENINTSASITKLVQFPEIQKIMDSLLPSWQNISESFYSDSLRKLAALPYFDFQEHILDQMDIEIQNFFYEQ